MKYTEDCYRLFIGWCLSYSANSLFTNRYMDRVLTHQDAVLLPSGQRPPLYANNHISFFKEKLIAWSEHMWHSCLLVTKVSGLKTKTPGQEYRVVHRFLLHIDRALDPYTAEERAVFDPYSLN